MVRLFSYIDERIASLEKTIVESTIILTQEGVVRYLTTFAESHYIHDQQLKYFSSLKETIDLLTETSDLKISVTNILLQNKDFYTHQILTFDIPSSTNQIYNMMRLWDIYVNQKILQSIDIMLRLIK